jgi:hypothetical protein
MVVFLHGELLGESSCLKLCVLTSLSVSYYNSLSLYSEKLSLSLPPSLILCVCVCVCVFLLNFFELANNAHMMYRGEMSAVCGS